MQEGFCKIFTISELRKIFKKRMKQIGKDMAAAQQELSSLVSQLTGDAYAVKALKELTEMGDWEQNITK